MSLPMKRILSLVTLFFLTSGFAGASVIRIADQDSFDRLGRTIKEEISRKEKVIRVEIQPGHYKFSERHIELAEMRCPDVAISITGKDVVLSGKGEHGPFKLSVGLIDTKAGRGVPMFRELKQAISVAEILDPATGLCRMAVDEAPVASKKAGNMYILITQWYRAKYYPVKEITEGFVYFMAPGVTDDRNPATSPNADFHYAKELPRYAILNHPARRDVPLFKKKRLRSPKGTRLERCDAGCFLRIAGGEFRSVTISGIEFLGSGGDGPLINFHRCGMKEGAKVSGCVFDGIKGDVLRVDAAPSVTFADNVVRNCHANGVEIVAGTRNAVIRHNRFINNGLDVYNYFCVRCQGINFLIADNYFEDFTYGAIGVGIWYKSPDKVIDCSGIVENNECCLSPAFNSGVYRNLMDSGAIYTWTINTDVTIRNNYIHDISGPYENRGIFCDDGTVNVKLLSNRVENVSNSYCIDLRRVASVETAEGSRIKRANVGNVMKDNVVDGSVRFEQREK